MSNGRPTVYNAELQARADEYLKSWELEGDAIPSIVGLACFLRISKSTVYLLEKEHPTFSDTLSTILTMQEKVTLNGGLRGDFNSTISKLVLANHGYHDKVEQQHTSPDGSMTPTAWVLEPVKPNDQSSDS